MYKGRFAPSPTGPLHEGSLVAALASWLDARAHHGQWLVRIEDVDAPRCIKGAAQTILEQLAICGLRSDESPVRQALRGTLYQTALDKLIAQGCAYPCGCSRKDIEDALASQGATRERHGEMVYPGTCRHGLNGKPARAWRFLTQGANAVQWSDRKLGTQQQDVEHDVGDFVLKRAGGIWAYQLAVVVDDAQQGITHVVRGQDLADNTARQVLLQEALGLPMPNYLHTPLVSGANGEKLSKQNGAVALDLSSPLNALRHAGKLLGITNSECEITNWLAAAVNCWRAEMND